MHLKQLLNMFSVHCNGPLCILRVSKNVFLYMKIDYVLVNSAYPNETPPMWHFILVYTVNQIPVYDFYQETL